MITDIDLREDIDARSPWQRMRMWALAHAVDDFYQGLVPATIPFFVLDRGYSYVGASALALAATLGGALPQPIFGIIADRKPMVWMAPVGLATAGIGAGLSGLVGSYAVVWTLLLASGLGIAMFHPAAGRDARQAAGHSASAMSIFAAGGSVGFFLAPALATPLLVHWGVGSTALFIPPAVLMAFVMMRRQSREANAPARAATSNAPDAWRPFAILTLTEVVRSVIFFGTNTFIALYWIRDLGASTTVGGLALTLFLVGGVAGTLLGGRIGDRFGLTRTVQFGSLAAIPAIAGMRMCTDSRVALLFAILSGIAVNIPFAVLIKLGQDYLPSRPGTASGVTLGLAVSIGGVFAPVLGMIADRHGPSAVFTVLIFVPAIAFALALLLPEPDRLNR